ncbi:DTW domain-containing protein [Vibrio parahaemolyticus]|nr:DTW domain-containing protein [Vibrio parahaemolyticus]EIT7127992.1 DTW domain-containing protein [Vibrio parahaemolyticus]
MSRYCSQCGKSRKACICQWIVPLASGVELIILQHTSEAHQHFILYPSEQSQCLSDIACTESERTRKTRLILLDGTWKKAYKMWQLSTNLHALTTVKLPEDLQGHYTIRKAPSDNSLSTVEAGFYALSLLEPDNDFSPLLNAFDRMIEFQIAQMPPGVFEKNYLNK